MRWVIGSGVGAQGPMYLQGKQQTSAFDNRSTSLLHFHTMDSMHFVGTGSVFWIVMWPVVVMHWPPSNTMPLNHKPTQLWPPVGEVRLNEKLGANSKVHTCEGWGATGLTCRGE